MASLETNINQVSADFQAIKNSLIDKGIEIPDGTKTSEYAGKIDDMYEAGKEAGLDEIWEVIQQGGKRNSYIYYFGNSWGVHNFKPKYDLVPTGQGGNGMFYWFNYHNSDPSLQVNLKEVLNERGLKLDTSKNLNFAGFMNYARFSEIPTIDFSSTTNTLSCFTDAYIRKVEKIVVRKELKYGDTSFRMPILENIEVEGEIGNTINFQWSSNLTKTSIESIVNHLSDTVGATLTLSKTAVNNAFGGEDSEEWIDLITPKSNTYDGLWTITLV